MKHIGVSQWFAVLVAATFAVGGCARDQHADKQLPNAQPATPAADAYSALNDPRTHAWIADNALHFNASGMDDSTLSTIVSDVDNRRVVFLGETGYAVSEYSKIKLSVVRTLHESLGFNVLAWDGPIWECTPLGSEAASYRADSLLKYCTFGGVWSTREVRDVFRYVETTQRTNRPLVLVGLEPEILRLDRTPEQLKSYVRLLQTKNPALADRVNNRIAALKQLWISDDTSRKRFADLAIAPLLDTVSTTLAAMSEQRGLSEVEHARLTLAATAARTNSYAIGRYAAPARLPTSTDVRTRFAQQKKLMAENLAYVVDTLYPAQKTIVWTSNYDARRAIGHGFEMNHTLGLAGVFALNMPNHSVFSLGMFASDGAKQSRQRDPVAFGAPASNTIEAMLRDASGRATYLKTSNQPDVAGTWWLRSPIKSAFDLYAWESMRLNDEFDAVVVVANATPSHRQISDFSLR